MATKREIKALIRGILERRGLTWAEPQEMLAILAKLHDELAKLLTAGGQFNAQSIRGLLAAVDGLIAQATADLRTFQRSATVRAWQRGVEDFEAPFELFQVGYMRGVTGFESDLVQQYLTLDRVTQITTEMGQLIRQSILNGVFMKATPYEVMAYITNVLGIRDQAGFRSIGTTGISAKAERIMRTELMTIQNAGAWERRGQALVKFPDLEEIWAATGDFRTRATHLAAHGQRKKAGEQETFTVGGYAARFPGDPMLPARERVNCRCTAIAFRPEWGEAEALLGPLADAVGRERGKRKKLKVTG